MFCVCNPYIQIYDTHVPPLGYLVGRTDIPSSRVVLLLSG